MTEEHKAKLLEGKKAKSSIRIKVDRWTIENYEHGWRIFEEGESNKKFYYSNLQNLFTILLDKKIRKKTANNLKELQTVINEALKSVNKTAIRLQEKFEEINK